MILKPKMIINFHTIDSKIDIKGAIVFSVGITSILLIITNLEGNMSFTNWVVIGSLSVIGIISYTDICIY